MVCSIDKISSGEGTVSLLPAWDREGAGQLLDAPKSACHPQSCHETPELCIETGVCSHAKTNKNGLVAPV